MTEDGRTSPRSEARSSRWWRRLRTFLRKHGARELALLLALLVAAGGTWAFVELADEVIEGERHALDLRIIGAMRVPGEPSNPIGPAVIEEAARDLTALGGNAVLTLVVVLVVTFLLLVRRYWRAGLLVATVLIGLGLSQLFKVVIGRPRPPAMWHTTETFTPSFPSGHSMLSAVVFLTLGALLAEMVGRWRLKAFFLGSAILLTMLVGLTRVYLGVHYPSDVLAGWSLGLAWAAIAWSIAAVWRRRRWRRRVGRDV